MNSLSWLLYFAEVSSNISFTLAFITILGAIATLIVTLFVSIPDKHSMTDTWIVQGPKIQKALLIATIVSLVGLLFPSQDTVYLIIASESAEMIVTSDSGQKMLGDIQSIVSLKLENIADGISSEASKQFQEVNK
jgi:hypothetical protein